MTEKIIENSILQFLRSLGVYCWKNQSIGVWDSTKQVYRKSKNSFHIKGVSDVLGVIEGRLIAIEVKNDKGKLSPEQRIFLTRINQEGGVAFVARSIDQVARELYKHFPEHKILKEMISHEWGKPTDIDTKKH